MQPPRITFRHILNSVLKVFKLEKGVLYTLRELSLRPGKAIRTYLLVDRSQMQDPIKFLFIMVALAALAFVHVDLKNTSASFQAGLNEGKKAAEASVQMTDEQRGKMEEQFEAIDENATEAEDFMANNYQFMLIFSIPFSAFWSFVHFRRKQWNAAEHLVINAYIFGYQSFLFALIRAAGYWLTPKSLDVDAEAMIVYLIASLVYSVWGYLGIFDLKAGKRIPLRGILLSLWVIFLSMLTYMISFSVILAVVVYIQ
ncbi:MAG: DUF3667 domain-containing protein [Bacteroidota bacterium]